MGAEDGHGHAYNLDSSIVSGAVQVVPRKQTIEFHQHHGTLELLEIVAWCEVVTVLVAFCDCATTADVRALLGGGWKMRTICLMICCGMLASRRMLGSTISGA